MLQTATDTTTSDPFFLAELSKLGPQQPPSAWSLPESQAYCRMWAKRQYENFSVVSFLLPRKIRQDFYNVYAYCRWSDNLADEVTDPSLSRSLLDWWQGQLSLCYSGRPAHPVLVALQSTIQQHNLPTQPFTDLLDAFRQDQNIHRYRDMPQLLDYCNRSANPVGRILLGLANVRDETSQALSDQICTGLQLANFCQDIARDAAIGRIYAPETLWHAHGASEQDFLARQVTEPLRALLASWVASSRVFFYQGWPLVERVPKWLGTDVDLFVRGGLAILDKIEQANFDVWTARPTVSKAHKLQLLSSSLLRRWAGNTVVPQTHPVAEEPR